MITRLIQVGGFSLICATTFAQSPLEKAVLTDLESAQTKLTAQRNAHSKERQTLSAEITELQNDLLLKRRQADISRRSIADQDAFLSGLRNKDYASSTIVESLNDSLRSYSLKLSTRLFPGEPSDQRLESAFEKPTDPNADITKRKSVQTTRH